VADVPARELGEVGADERLPALREQRRRREHVGGEHLMRGVDFVFSRHRLNVAVSRAQSLAYVVSTDELLNTRAKDVETMQLIGTLCALVEAAEEVAPTG
jgi:superfamily I DNA and/or RNA helicase